MGFAGLGNEKQRADIIDYLHTLSHNPEPLPSN
jgi:cytochrome c2